MHSTIVLGILTCMQGQPLGLSSGHARPKHANEQGGEGSCLHERTSQGHLAVAVVPGPSKEVHLLVCVAELSRYEGVNITIPSYYHIRLYISILEC